MNSIYTIPLEMSATFTQSIIRSNKKIIEEILSRYHINPVIYFYSRYVGM